MLARRFLRLRHLSASPVPTYSSAKDLQERLAEIVPVHQAKVKKLSTEYGNKKVGEVTISQVIGGMRSIGCMFYDTSLLDPEEGIRFRGYSIPELQKYLPKAPGGEQPLPEGLFWLLMTGEIPTPVQVKSVTAEFHKRSQIPLDVIKVIDGLPREMHPMTSLSIGVLAMQPHSVFSAAYARGDVDKKQFWRLYLEDTLTLLGVLPGIAARIFQNKYHGKCDTLVSREDLDWSANFAHMLGYGDNPQFIELMRMYLTIHADHEGGNVSAHATQLVGSALGDPFYSFSAGMNGLAAPLHGLANQEVLRWIMKFRKKYGFDLSKEKLIEALWDTLNSGQVIPGYGHAVLRKTDPRYTSQREFALKHLPEDPLFKLVSAMYEVVPDVLTKHGKTKNPWPNVDAHSGVLLHHYGLKQEDYYTVLFGVSRAIGVLSHLVISRYLGLPIERPKSLDYNSLLKIALKP